MGGGGTGGAIRARSGAGGRSATTGGRGATVEGRAACGGSPDRARLRFRGIAPADRSDIYNGCAEHVFARELVALGADRTPWARANHWRRLADRAATAAGKPRTTAAAAAHATLLAPTLRLKRAEATPPTLHSRRPPRYTSRPAQASIANALSTSMRTTTRNQALQTEIAKTVTHYISRRPREATAAPRGAAPSR